MQGLRIPFCLKFELDAAKVRGALVVTAVEPGWMPETENLGRMHVELPNRTEPRAEARAAV